MYKAITFFTDVQDNGYAYHTGDIFPRDGLAVTDERIKELSTKKNRRGKALIAKVKTQKGKENA